MASGQASSAYNLAKKNEKEFSDMRSTLEGIEKQIKELKVQMEKVLKEIDKIK
jgi:archaellum component FlaC